MKAAITLALVCGAFAAATILKDDQTRVETTAITLIQDRSPIAVDQPVIHYRDGVQIAEYPTVEDAAIIANLPEDSLQTIIDNNINLSGDVYSFE